MASPHSPEPPQPARIMSADADASGDRRDATLALRAVGLGLALAVSSVVLIEEVLPDEGFDHLLAHLAAIAVAAVCVGAYVARAFRLQRARVIGSLSLQARIVGSVADGVGHGMILVDANGLTVFQNACDRALFGPMDSERDQRTALFEEDEQTELPAEARPLTRALRGETVREARLFVRSSEHPEGRHVRMSTAPLFADGEARIVGAFSMFTDITEERSTAAQLRQAQRLEAIGQLTGGLAHDFNNLLTIILGNVGAALASEAAERDATLASDLRMVEEAALRGSDLTHRLLAFARRQTLRPEVCDANVLLRDLEPLLARTLGSGVHCTLKLSNEPVMVRVDVGGLENALVNLAVNARDAIGGAGRIELATAIREPGTAGVDGDVPLAELCVSDDGPGVPEDLLGRIFEPFFTTKGAGAGSGLGLSMVHGFAHQSGGSIRVHNPPSGGARFEILLPLVASTPQPSPRSEPRREAASSGRRVLVVEDDEHVGRLFRRLLERMGFVVDLEVEATPALERFRAGERFDLLVSDIVLPGGMDGVQLVQRVRELDGAQPVLLCSGYDRHALDAMHGGATRRIDLLRKPFHPSEFEAHVRAALAGDADPVRA